MAVQQPSDHEGRAASSDSAPAAKDAEPAAAGEDPGPAPADPSLLARLRRTISSTDSPVNWLGAGLMALSGLLAVGLGELLDHRTMPVTAIVGLVLGLVVASAPMFMAIRLLLLNGALIVLAAVLGVSVADNAVAAGLVMAALAFIGAVWTAIPVVGPIFSGLPVLVFLLLVAKSTEFTGGAATAHVALAAAVGIVPPLVLAVVLSIADPRKVDRTLVASAWTTDVPPAKRTLATQVLLLDGAPAPLIYVTTQGVLGIICRDWLVRRGLIAAAPSAASPSAPPAVPPGQDEQQGDAGHAAAAAAGDANASAVRAALGPRGKSVPRQVVIDVGPMHDAAEKAAAAGDKAAAGTWRLWASSQQQAAAALGGQVVPRLLLRPALMIVLALLRSLLHPDVSAFRYGIQRALGLGLAIFALVLSHGNEGVFWIAVTLMTVLQQNMPQTLVKTLQRVIGTFLGVAVALACAAVLPSWVLVPWLAGIAILIALAFQSRNYALMSGLIAFSIVLLMGAPSDKVAEFAGMRALNVFIGGVIAALIARVVFPVHADPARRRQQVITALQNLLGAIRDRLADPKSLSVEAVIGKQAVAVTKLSNLRNAIDDERDRQVAEAYRKDLAGLTACNEELFVIGTVVVRLVENPVKGDLSVDDALTEIGDQINNLAKDAPVAVSSPTASGT